MADERRAGDLEREADVLGHRLVRQQPEVLEHDADPAAELRHLAAPHAAEVAARHPDVAVARHQLANEETDERALAGPRRPDEEDEVAGRDLDVDIGQRHLAVRVGEAGVDHADDRAGRVGARRAAQEGSHRSCPVILASGPGGAGIGQEADSACSSPMRERR